MSSDAAPTTIARGVRRAIRRCYRTVTDGRRAGGVGYPRPVNPAGIPLALSYDDVLLVPRRSTIESRSAVE